MVEGDHGQVHHHASPWVSVMAGMMGGATEAVVLQPLDVTKTRLQLGAWAPAVCRVLPLAASGGVTQRRVEEGSGMYRVLWRMWLLVVVGRGRGRWGMGAHARAASSTPCLNCGGCHDPSVDVTV